jgi:hypothetical protein
MAIARMILDRVGAHRTLYHVVSRLRCRTCGNAFARVITVTDPASGANERGDAPDGPRITLVGGVG